MERSKLQTAMCDVLHNNGIDDAHERSDSIVEIMHGEEEIVNDRDMLEDFLIQRFDHEGFEDADIMSEEVIEALDDAQAWEDEDDTESEVDG
jgi:hypothetical protein